MKKATVITIIFIAVVLSFMGEAGTSAIIYKGMASWYSERDTGILATTANMERFNERERTCAIWDIPFNTILKVTNLENNKSVYVRVNDRGPAKRLNRAIDLTKGAFSDIADLKDGLISVSIEIM